MDCMMKLLEMKCNSDLWHIRTYILTQLYQIVAAISKQDLAAKCQTGEFAHVVVVRLCCSCF